MKVLNAWLERQISLCLVMLLVVPIGEAATTPQPRERRATGSAVTGEPRWQNTGRANAHIVGESSASAYYPDSPGSLWAQAADHSQETAAAQNTQTAPQITQTKDKDSAPVPVGTAVAPYEKSGVPASRPAGAAIAPAKQRRIRSFAIRTALVVGAVVAIGAVAAASLSSPSQPH
jgi:hypothetical protein